MLEFNYYLLNLYKVKNAENESETGLHKISFLSVRVDHGRDK